LNHSFSCAPTDPTTKNASPVAGSNLGARTKCTDDDVTIALKGNALVFSAEGGLKLSYKKKAQ
jgi:hypothetical protein